MGEVLRRMCVYMYCAYGPSRPRLPLGPSASPTCMCALSLIYFLIKKFQEAGIPTSSIKLSRMIYLASPFSPSAAMPSRYFLSIGTPSLITIYHLCHKLFDFYDSKSKSIVSLLSTDHSILGCVSLVGPLAVLAAVVLTTIRNLPCSNHFFTM